VAAHADPVRGVIFDMDGLLVDTGTIWRTVGDEVFAELGVDISGVTSRGVVMGMGVADAMDLLLAYAGFAEGEHADLEQRIVERVLDAIPRRAALLPGARGALDFCERRGLVAALASGSTPEVIDAVLAHVGLAGRFAAVCSTVDEPFGKPHPSVFLTAAERIGERPCACLVLEDALNGCIAAKAASMRVIAVPDRAVADDPRYAIADLVIPSLERIADDEALAVMGLDALPVA
jgi:mannitol-1-/sugar-/sorbitol-6-/2-deoxyglucose-6-phosphatase